ncbi:uncharacterized protein LOC126968819 [Leptidea sinapis]|uniref:uncharacterized protein LOC126968819 n=1 Tax=Leptidea sinapis TaxID=189913 RepID=UPI0021C29B09|nr:uncharacterized protein LOC126968819 [Leptidea sinapis]
MNKSIDSLIKNNLSGKVLEDFNRIYYGKKHHSVLVLDSTNELDFEIAGYSLPAEKEQLRQPRIVRLGLIQHSIVLTTDSPIIDQRQAIFDKVRNIINAAALEGVQILCLQETWSMPFFLCTKERTKWGEFAESAEYGPSTLFLSELAAKYKMVIISPILEVDDEGVWWNTAVIINEKGEYIGKHRKNHLPSVGSFSEISYYSPGNTGHMVFDTNYAKLAVNICYGRHHALNWLMFGLNGAEIVFNPSATISEFGETFWGIEARNAAIANNYFTCSINRVGKEEFTVGSENNITRSYYGSSYITAPDGCRTPSLSKTRDGLLITEIDLNMCRQLKDQWGFSMTSRLDMYAENLISYITNHCTNNQ